MTCKHCYYYRWALGHDSGVSSMTIMQALTGIRCLRHGPDVPHDPADFGRCYRMLVLFPELRPRIGEVADTFPIWRKMADAWDELESLWLEEAPTGNCPMLYARIQELQP